MGDFQIIHKITLPKNQDADAFATFMRDEYFPAVHKGPTRIGQVTGLELSRGISETGEDTQAFIFNVGFSGMSTGNARLDDKEVQHKFDAFGAHVERLGAFSAVAAWNESDPV